MTTSKVSLGLKENLAQFSLLVVINAFVGAMVGTERSILSAIAEQEFQLAARTAILSFIVVFGVTKALTNYLAGRLSDAYGRKVILIGGLAHRDARTVPAHVGAVVELGALRERAARRQPGAHLVVAALRMRETLQPSEARERPQSGHKAATKRPQSGHKAATKTERPQGLIAS